MEPSEIEKILEKALPGSQVRASDMTGGGDHWQVRVISDAFVGLSLIEQHQLVYKALGDLIPAKIHALSLDTQVPGS